MGQGRKKKKGKVIRQIKAFGLQTLQLFMASIAVIGALTGLYQIDFVRDIIYRPDVEISRNESVRTGEIVISEFYIKNNGNKTATDLAILVQGLPTDTIKLLPFINNETLIYSKTTGQKETLVKIKSLSPNESTSIIVFSIQSEFETQEKEFVANGIKFNWPKVIVTDSNETKSTDI